MANADYTSDGRTLCSRRQRQRTMTLLEDGVLAPRHFFSARVTEGVRQNPVFWFPREPIPRALSPALPATAGERSPAALRFLGDRRHMALPPLRLCDVCRSYTHRCGTLAVLLLRYLLMLRTTAGHRRACRTPADSCACHSPNQFLPAFRASVSSNFFANLKAFGDPTPTFEFQSGHSSSACGGSKAAFISHIASVRRKRQRQLPFWSPYRKRLGFHFSFPGDRAPRRFRSWLANRTKPLARRTLRVGKSTSS